MIPERQQDQKNPAVELAKNVGKDKLKKSGKKVAKKAIKKGAVLAKKAISIALKALLKVIVSILGYIGVPGILIIAGIVVVVIIVFLSFSFFFGTGSDLDNDDQELYEYMVSELDKTIDTSLPEQKKYRVPEELLAAVIQSDIITEDYKGKEKDLIKEMAQALKPTFEYEDFNEYKETYTKTCEDGKCKSTKVKKKDNWNKKITFVNAWNGSATYTYSEDLSDWTYKKSEKIEVRTRKVRVETVNDEGVTVVKYVDEDYDVKIETYKYSRNMKVNRKDSKVTQDYAAFDSILNQYGFGINDKKMVEAMYEFTTDKKLGYIDWLEGNGGANFGFGGGFTGNVTPGDNVPAKYMEYYRNAEKKYGVDWYVLAALHFVETSFSDSQDPSNVSTVGAIGPFQFMPLTWLGWSASNDYGGTSLGNASIPVSVISSPSSIKKYGGYGVDGDGDGKADPWSVADASMSAANYLVASGYHSDKRKALYSYNHAQWYVDKVLSYADQFHKAATYTPENGMPPPTKGEVMAPATGQITTNFGWDTLNGQRRIHYGMDIGKGGRSSVPIVAFADGSVKNSYFSSTYGNVVIISHTIGGQKIESLYAHMENRNVSTGQKVKKGTLLGYMGNTGYSYGAHLHFELHKGSWNAQKSNAFDPLTMVKIPAS